MVQVGGGAATFCRPARSSDAVAKRRRVAASWGRVHQVWTWSVVCLCSVKEAARSSFFSGNVRLDGRALAVDYGVRTESSFVGPRSDPAIKRVGGAPPTAVGRWTSTARSVRTPHHRGVSGS